MKPEHMKKAGMAVENRNKSFIIYENFNCIDKIKHMI